jgi:D-beta-D-heptose 7-phosphate kinase/D-beta-D-heptose 1-phosphate adenosyltransferase
VKGGDYDPKKIVGYQEVTENGGSVKIIRFLEGRSTTAIAHRIQALG